MYFSQGYLFRSKRDRPSDGLHYLLSLNGNPLNHRLGSCQVYLVDWVKNYYLIVILTYSASNWPNPTEYWLEYNKNLVRPIGLVVEFSPMVRETGVQSLVESYIRLKRWYLIPPCLTFSIIRYVLRVKWSNLGKRVAPSPTPRCSNYWKGSFRVALNYGRQLYLLTIKTTKK